MHQYDGLLPLGLPFHVAALNGQDHGAALTGIWGAYQPDVVLSVQDFPWLTLWPATQRALTGARRRR